LNSLDGLAIRVAELQGTLSTVQADSKRLFRAFQDGTQASAEHRASLDALLEALERETEGHQKSNVLAFESLSRRVMDMSTEVVQWPTATEVHSALERLDALAASTEDFRLQHQARIERLENSMGHCWQRVDSALPGLEAGVLRHDSEFQNVRKELEDASSLWRERLEETSRGLEVSIGKARKESRDIFESAREFLHTELRQDLERLYSRLWGETADQGNSTVNDCSDSVAANSLTCGSIPLLNSRLSAAEGSFPSLGARLDAVERHVRMVEESSKTKASMLEKHIHAVEEASRTKAERQELLHSLATKADVGHTHDRLVSTDGSITFAL